MKISRLYGLEIYIDNGKVLGKVNDIILNLEEGRIIRLTTEPLRGISREEAGEVLKAKSVLYKNVKSVQDIVIVGKSELSSPEPERKEEKRSGLRALLKE